MTTKKKTPQVRNPSKQKPLDPTSLQLLKDALAGTLDIRRLYPDMPNTLVQTPLRHSLKKLRDGLGKKTSEELVQEVMGILTSKEFLAEKERNSSEYAFVLGQLDLFVQHLEQQEEKQ